MASKEKKYLEIRQKQKIKDVDALDRLYEVIKFYTNVTNYESILFSFGDEDFTFDYNIFQEPYLSEFNHIGIKNISLVFHDLEISEIIYRNIQNLNTIIDLNVVFFDNKSSALDWINDKPKEIQIQN
jgi:hypothetical protein